MNMRAPGHAPKVDRGIGDAFPIVEEVYRHLEQLKYLAENSEKFVGKQIEFRSNPDLEIIEWRYQGDDWQFLISYSQLTGVDLSSIEETLNQIVDNANTQIRQDIKNDLETFTGTLVPVAQWSEVPAHDLQPFNTQAQALLNRSEYLREKFEAANSISVRVFGAKLDGVSNDYSAVLRCIKEGVKPVFDGPCLVSPPSSEESAELLSSVDSWQTLDKVRLQLHRSNNIQMSRVLNVQNPGLVNLTIAGHYTQAGSVSTLSYVSGPAKARLFKCTTTEPFAAEVGDYITLYAENTGWTNFGLFVSGAWRIEAISGNEITFLCKNPFPTLPEDISIGVVTARIIHTVVKFPRDQIGIRVNGGQIGGLTNTIYKGAFDFATEAPVDGKGDGIQIGGAADTFNTGLNASEQVQQGAVWAQRVGFVDFQGNGIQGFHGVMFGSEIFTTGCAWRGQQAAGTALVLNKYGCSNATGASSYESEAMGNMNAEGCIAVGSLDQGMYSIGLSQIEANGARIAFNAVNAVDVRNGGHVILDGANVDGSGMPAINNVAGHIVAGNNAVISGNVVMSEGAHLTMKGASSFTGSLSIENGCFYQDKDGNAIRNSFESVRSDTKRLRNNINSLNDVFWELANLGSSSWTSLLVLRESGVLYSPIASATLGRSTNPWNGIYAERFHYGASGANDFYGTGSPEGGRSAPPGSTYRNTLGGAGTSFYVKESGTGNTGWVAK